MRFVSRWLAVGLLSSALSWAQGAFNVHGYLQGRFTDQDGTSERLEMRRARLIVNGEPFSRLSYSVQVDVVKQPYLMDAALTWSFSPLVRVTAGQFKIPFSAESLIRDNANAPIARSRAVLSLAPGRDTGVQARDTGLQLAGTLNRARRPLVEYAAGLFRGQLLMDSPTAHYRAAAGRLIVHPLPGLSAGGDWYGSFSTSHRPVKRRSAAEGGYEHGRLTLRAEQLWARDGALHRRGGYLLGAWRLSPHWEPLARTDWLTTNADRPDTTSIACMTGLNFYVGRFLKVSANTGAQHNPGGRGVTSIFLVQTMLGF